MKNNQNDTLVVVRLRRSFWHDTRGVYQRTELKYLRRNCVGWNFLHEDCQNIGAEELVPRIVNLDKCKDGVYQLIIVNPSIDWETGTMEDYDYKLVPFSPNET